MIEWLYIYLAEWPWLCVMSLAVYLAFEHWRSPDLTIDGAFTAGIVSVYFVSAHAQSTGSCLLMLAGLWLLLTSLFSGATWLLTALRLPPLFAGLLVLLASYSVNYHLNGGSTSQSLDLRTSIPEGLRIPALTTAEQYFVLSSVATVGILVATWALERSRLGLWLFLARRTNDGAASQSLNLRAGAALIAGMLIYNGLAFAGGMQFAVQNSFSGISFLAAITPGIACMFIVRSIRQLAASPQIKRSLWPAQRPTVALIRLSESIPFVFALIAVITLAITIVRFELRGFATPGMLNALTAAGTIAIWLLCSAIAAVLGKPVTGLDDERQ